MNNLFRPRIFQSLLTILIIGFSVSSINAQQLQLLDKIVAVVNESIILQSELDQAVGTILLRYQDRRNQLPPLSILEKQVLDRLILNKLQVVRAEESGIRISDQEVSNAIANIAQQNNVPLSQLGAHLMKDEMTLDDLRHSIYDELETQRLKQIFSRTQINVSESEIDAALAAQADSLQYHLAHILIALPEGPTPEQIDIASKKIAAIKQQIDQGNITFSAAAVRYSDSPNALEGGDLGWRDLNEIPSAFSATLHTMTPGNIISPTRGSGGIQLVQLIDSRETENPGTSKVTQYRVDRILIAVDDNANTTQEKTKIDTLHAKLVGGANFAALAKENSNDTNTAVQGGRTDWFEQNIHSKELNIQIAELQDGQISKPFKTDEGWEIIRRVSTREIIVADEQNRQQLRQSIGQRKFDAQWENFLRQLRDEAYIDIRLPSLTVGQEDSRTTTSTDQNTNEPTSTGSRTR